MRFWAILIRLLVVSCFVFLLFFFDPHFQNSSPLPSSQNQIRIYSLPAGDYLQDTLLQSIRKAQSSIFLIIYTLKDHKVMDALNKKAEQGVQVTIIYDGQASSGVEKYLSSKIHLVSRLGKGLMHLKLLAIDEEVAWLGSTNFTSDAFKKDANLMVGIFHPPLAQIVKQKVFQFIKEPFEKPLAPTTFFIDNQNIALHFLPDHPQAVSTLIDLIGTAKKTISIAMYTFTRQDLAQALAKAKEKGIEVHIILDKNHAKGSGKKVVQSLKKQGIYPRIYTESGLMHHKFMIIDTEVFVHGSSNWTKGAFEQNEDFFMIMKDLNPEQKKALHDIWHYLYTHSA